MPSFDIVKTWSKPRTFRVQSVSGSFTLTEEKMSKRFSGSIPFEQEEWQIGVIVGRSGTGKTSIAKTLFPDGYIRNFDYTHESILDDFPTGLQVTEITKALCSVGFASPPDWLKQYESLSQGEKMRVDIARALLLNQDLIVFDEFTSVVDREIAKVSAYAISKAIRKTAKKFIAVTCHYDVIEWLEPDWIFSTDTMEYTSLKKRRPAIQIEIRQCNRSLWRLFRDYHYLNRNLNYNTTCFAGLYNGKPVCFIAFIRYPYKVKFLGVSRLVVLPDYQGIGIGLAFLTTTAKYMSKTRRLPVHITSSNPQLKGLLKNPSWKLIFQGHTSDKSGFREAKHMRKSSAANRLTLSFKLADEKLERPTSILEAKK